ncbi:Na/Pi cotransporter family protein [Brevibacillus borstelensis]|uniref:Na/Pi cotransporter family protein n=1 Tax=Brevibacillus borstelensis TaxID=45462 RepID=UPI000F083FE4|nr:Na/Pi symporter [Brevibacillus borstelensis]MCM3623881.1 Na/Pi symporter [Brevibacillus borstelensis]MED1743307.1 Na/Pi symporter [Brevibacillus borstelensis]MED1853173.1 Na/Pi symporter [Brevibacillus borstelensis]MED1874512.1 Na/Pi symporter [Brevibacillus borstelensis]MED1885450.1 Na/Pi symporter [Brevibacillus borstelensis]
MIGAVLAPFTFGLSFFLLGMYAMRTGFQNLAGKRMADWLARFTRTPVHSFWVGLLSTFVLQSSSAVTVLTIGLTHAGMIGFAQTVGIILGTNVGTTVTTELIALRLESFAVPMLLVGVAMWLLPRRLPRCIGLVVAGFGLIFLGIDTMQVMAGPLQQSDTFRALFLESSHSIWLGLLTGTIFTALIHSSSATTAITMGLMSHHILSMETALAIVLGANIGTCFTAVIASFGTNAASRQVAWCHTLFNGAGALLFLPFLSQLALVSAFLTDSPSMQIAHSQTIFNVICSLAALPFTRQIAAFVRWMVPDKKRT